MTVSSKHFGVILVDTNLFPGGRLTEDALAHLRWVAEAGVKVLVPEVVAAELASHAWQDVHSSVRQLTLLGALDVAPTAEDLEASVLRLLRDVGVEIPTTPVDAWRKALRARVFRVAPALPKPGPKAKPITTGAADHLVLQHAQEAAREFGQVTVLTRDVGLTQSLESLPVNEFARVDVEQISLTDLRARVDTTRLSEEEAIQVIRQVADAAALVPGGLGNIVGMPFVGRAADDSYVVTLALFDRSRHSDDIYSSTWTYRNGQLVKTLSPMTLMTPFSSWLPEWTQTIDEVVAFEADMFPIPLRPRQGVASGAVQLQVDAGMLLLVMGDDIVHMYPWRQETVVRAADWEVEQVVISDAFTDRRPVKGTLFAAALKRWQQEHELVKVAGK